MPIIAETPVVIAPVPGDTYPQQWIQHLEVHSPTTEAGRVRIILRPYNPATQGLGPAAMVESIETHQLWAAAAAVPEVGAAMQAVIDCVGPLRAWIKAQEDAAQPATPTA